VFFVSWDFCFQKRSLHSGLRLQRVLSLAMDSVSLVFWWIFVPFLGMFMLFSIENRASPKQKNFPKQRIATKGGGTSMQEEMDQYHLATRPNAETQQ
jgi:hypothetical protein